MVCETWISALGMDVLLQKGCILILCIIGVYISYLGLDVKLLLGSMTSFKNILSVLSALLQASGISLTWLVHDRSADQTFTRLMNTWSKKGQRQCPRSFTVWEHRLQVEEWVPYLKPKTQHVVLWGSRLLLHLAKRKPQELETLL